MRGIVMEKNNDKLIVLTDNGQFIEIKNLNKSIQIGQQVHLNNKGYNKSLIRKAIAVAALFLIMVTGGYGVYGYYMPFGYIDVDINPTIELSYNLYDQVIDIKGLNEAGTHIIQKIDNYKNKPVRDIINKVIDTAIEEKYIKPEQQNSILVTITEDGRKIDDKEIIKSVDNHMKKEKIETEVILIKSDKKEHEAAKKNNLSPGKQMLINKALSYSDENSNQDMYNKSVKEIMEIIKENKKKDKRELKEDKNNMKYERKDKESDKYDDINSEVNSKNKVNSKNQSYNKENLTKDKDDSYENDKKNLKNKHNEKYKKNKDNSNKKQEKNINNKSHKDVKNKGNYDLGNDDNGEDHRNNEDDNNSNGNKKSNKNKGNRNVKNNKNDD